MLSEDLGDRVLVHHRVRFGDCDPARIAYTGQLVDFAIVAIDEFLKVALGGPGWYELNLDHGIGVPFVSLSVDFAAPVTPRASLQTEVHVTGRGRSSISFAVTASQTGVPVFAGRFTSVFVELSTLKSREPPDWIIRALDRFLPVSA